MSGQYPEISGIPSLPTGNFVEGKAEGAGFQLIIFNS